MKTIDWLIFYGKNISQLMTYNFIVFLLKYVDVEMIMDQMKKQSVVISCHVESCLNIWEQTDRLGMNQKKNLSIIWDTMINSIPSANIVVILRLYVYHSLIKCQFFCAMKRWTMINHMKKLKMKKEVITLLCKCAHP